MYDNPDRNIGVFYCQNFPPGTQQRILSGKKCITYGEIQTKIEPTGEKKWKIIFFWWVVISNRFVCIFELLNQDKMNNELTPYIEYYSNGNVYIKGQKNPKGQEEGLWEWFDFNGNIRLRIPFKEGKEDGIEEVFGENGNIKWRTQYKGGKEDGIMEEFYENGNIESRTSYKEGKIDGIVEEFDEQGNITETTLWKNGELIETTEH